MSVDLKNSNNSTPLHLSAQDGNLDATKSLVQSGAAINSTNKFGTAPLQLRTTK
jgi:ankyrin repeat protein